MGLLSCWAVIAAAWPAAFSAGVPAIRGDALSCHQVVPEGSKRPHRGRPELSPVRTAFTFFSRAVSAWPLPQLPPAALVSPRGLPLGRAHCSLPERLFSLGWIVKVKPLRVRLCPDLCPAPPSSSFVKPVSSHQCLLLVSEKVSKPRLLAQG